MSFEEGTTSTCDKNMTLTHFVSSSPTYSVYQGLVQYILRPGIFYLNFHI